MRNEVLFKRALHREERYRLPIIRRLTLYFYQGYPRDFNVECVKFRSIPQTNKYLTTCRLFPD